MMTPAESIETKHYGITTTGWQRFLFSRRRQIHCITTALALAIVVDWK
jgi:hypothetical protein